MSATQETLLDAIQSMIIAIINQEDGVAKDDHQPQGGTGRIRRKACQYLIPISELETG